MNKSELISEMAKQLNSKKEAEEALDSLLGAITQGLKKGEKITLTGFGSFKVSKRKARTGRNPRTGEQVVVSEKYVPFFKTGKDMRERLNTAGG